MLNSMNSRATSLRTRTHRLTIAASLIGCLFVVILVLTSSTTIHTLIIAKNQHTVMLPDYTPGTAPTPTDHRHGQRQHNYKHEIPNKPGDANDPLAITAGAAGTATDPRTGHHADVIIDDTKSQSPSNKSSSHLPGHDHDHTDESPTQPGPGEHVHPKMTKVFNATHNHTHDVIELSDVQKAILAVQEAKNQADIAACREWQSKYQIVSGSSWGTADATIRAEWMEHDCDTNLALADYPKYIEAHPELLAPIVVPANRVAPPLPATELPSIAICICTTTRNVHVRSLEDLSLFNSLLPSVVSTAEPGYEYWLYVLYDVGDTYYDNAQHLEEIRAWVNKIVIQPLLTQHGIHSRLVLEAFDNKLHKPGPAFNYLTHLAYIDDATFIYRINDDTSFNTQWAKTMTTELLAMEKPYGVVGPLCREGNTRILTHDMTHRLHHDILTTHYPPSLSDWWMDDWVSRAYGTKRTKLVESVIVKHSTSSHGTRYSVDASHGPLLGVEIELTRLKIEKWMESQGPTMKQTLEDYRTDNFHFHFRKR